MSEKIALDHAYLDGRYLNPADFITPQNPQVQAVAASIIEKLGEGDSPAARLREAYNYVTLNIKYVTDKKVYGFEEVWQKPSLTLQRGLGDCEDTSFLLCSLLHALNVRARVVFGEWRGTGHAWVEAWVDGSGGILETTSGQPFTGFADPAMYSAEARAGAGPEDPIMALMLHVAPGLILFGVGAFLMIDDVQDAFKLELSTAGHPLMPWLEGVPHLHHFWIGILLVIISIMVIAVGVVLWLLKYV